MSEKPTSSARAAMETENEDVSGMSLSSVTSVTVPMTFIDDTTHPLLLTDKKHIEKMPYVLREICKQFPDWKTRDEILLEPLHFEFPWIAGDFFLRNFDKFTLPEKLDNPTFADYPGTKDLAGIALGQMRDMALQIGCIDFANCMRFALGQYVRVVDEARIAEMQRWEPLKRRSPLPPKQVSQVLRPRNDELEEVEEEVEEEDPIEWDEEEEEEERDIEEEIAEALEAVMNEPDDAMEEDVLQLRIDYHHY